MAGCTECCDVLKAFEEAKKAPLHSWRSVYGLLLERVCANKLEVYASDCDFDKALDEIAKEVHFAYYFYLRCHKCGEIYYMGICVRGTPVFKTSEEFSENQIERTVKSGIGTFFNNK